MWHFPLDKLVICHNGTTIEDRKCRVLVPRKKKRTHLAKLPQKLRFSLFKQSFFPTIPTVPKEVKKSRFGVRKNEVSDFTHDLIILHLQTL